MNPMQSPNTGVGRNLCSRELYPAKETPLGGSDELLVWQSFPDYGVIVAATTINDETGAWSHGQYGWYKDGEWGKREYQHDHIASWKPLPNA